MPNQRNGNGSSRRASRKYSNKDYESINSLNRSEIDRSRESSNAKIQLKNLNFLLRPNSALKYASSPNSFIAQNQSLIESEYPLIPTEGHIDERLIPRPLKHSRSNSKLRGIQKPARAYSGSRKSSVQDQKSYSDYPNTMMNHDDALRQNLDIPSNNIKFSLKRFVGGRKPNNKIRKHIRITDQYSNYMDNAGENWFNVGDNDVKVVEDISMYLLDGDISDEDETTENFLDNSLEMYLKKDFNKVKKFKNQLKL